VEKSNPSVWCLVPAARAMAASLSRQDHIWITVNQLVRYYENEFDEMLCELDSTENLGSFEQYPALPSECSNLTPQLFFVSGELGIRSLENFI